MDAYPIESLDVGGLLVEIEGLEFKI